MMIRLLTRTKFWFYRFLVFLGLYAVLELGSLGILAYREGTLFSYRRYREEQRATERQVQQPGGAAGNHFFVVHPYLGTVRNPGWQGHYLLEDPITRYGFCDTDSPIRKRAANRVIVGVLGGSVASIFAKQGREKLQQELQASPRFAGKQVEVVNLAISGHQQPQQVMALNYALALGGEFDIIMNIDGFNEVAHYARENWPAGVHPIYPRNWHRVVTNLPDPTAIRLTGEMTYLQEQRGRWASWVLNSPLHHSVTMNLIWRIRDRRFQNEITRCAHEIEQLHKRGLPYRAVGPPFTLADEKAMYNQRADLWQRCSVQLHRTCVGHGIAYYHFLQPNQYVPGSKYMSPRERKRAWLENDLDKYGVEVGYPLLIQRAPQLRAEGVRFHDLRWIFKDHKEPLYVDTCCHFGRRGNELMAQAIAAAIVETEEPPQHTP